MKQYIVNTANENHFFSSKKEALKDFTEGKNAMKKIGERGCISLYLTYSYNEENEYDWTDKEELIKQVEI